MTKQINLTPIEKKVLQNIHLKGSMGKCGRMTSDKRMNVLMGLIVKGLLTPKMTVTKLGIDVSLPSAPLHYFILI